jgi:hypothetical protein
MPAKAAVAPRGAGPPREREVGGAETRDSDDTAHAGGGLDEPASGTAPGR